MQLLIRGCIDIRITYKNNYNKGNDNGININPRSEAKRGFNW